MRAFFIVGLLLCCGCAAEDTVTPSRVSAASANLASGSNSRPPTNASGGVSGVLQNAGNAARELPHEPTTNEAPAVPSVSAEGASSTTSASDPHLPSAAGATAGNDQSDALRKAIRSAFAQMSAGQLDEAKRTLLDPAVDRALDAEMGKPGHADHVRLRALVLELLVAMTLFEKNAPR